MGGFVEKYLLISLKDFSLSEFDIPINLIIISLCIALCVGAYSNYKTQSLYAHLTKRLIRLGCVNASCARKLSELGLAESRAITKGIVSRRGRIKQILSYTLEKPDSVSNSDENTAQEISKSSTPCEVLYDTDSSENTVKSENIDEGEGDSKKAFLPLCDENVKDAFFYIPEDQMDAANGIINGKNSDLRTLIASISIIIAVGALLFFTMPQILPLLRELLI